MKCEYGVGPMHYIDGVAGYKAGEWAGLKSCKFGATRRIIRPICSGIIFNENEPPLLAKRKLLAPGPSPEYIFKPCCKMTIPESDKKDKINSIKKVDYHPSIAKERHERRHHFQYKVDYQKAFEEKQKNISDCRAVSNEFHLMQTIGFKKKFYNDMPNNKLLGLSFTKDKLNRMTMTYRNPFEVHQATDRHLGINQTKEEVDKGITYVNNLNQWEQKTLPKVTK